MRERHLSGSRVEPLLAIILAWLLVVTAWLAAAPTALAAKEVVRLSDVAQDPRVLAVAALLVLAAWLGIAGGWRPGHRHR